MGSVRGIERIGRVAAVIMAAAAVTLGCGSPRSGVPGGEARREETGSRRRPSILLLTIDTLRADHVSFDGYGRDTTPVLSRLAGGAVVYRGARSTSSWTVPSVVSWLTGVSPLTHGVFHGVTRNGRVFEQEVVPSRFSCFPELLHAAGYRTFGVTANAHLDSEHGFGRGFDQFVCPGFKTAPEVVSIVKEWFRSGEGEGTPVFLWVHFFDPHAPYFRRNPWFSRYAPDATPHEMDMLRLAHRTWPKIPAEIRRNKERYLDLLGALYDSEIAFCDSWIGRMLKELPFLEQYWIIVAADHGEELGDHGSVGYGRNLYDETLRVPLFVRPPGGGEPARIDEPVSAVDIPRTILAIAGADAGPQWQGRILPGLPLPGSGPRSEAVLAHLSRFPDRPGYVALVDGTWKLIRNLRTDRLSLYDLEHDPGEHTDLAAREKDRTVALEDRLKSMIRALPPPPDDPVRAAISRRREEQLRSLGYLQ